jgi:hypothetical protein
MWSTISHKKNERKPDLLAMTKADREALTKQIKESLQQRIAEARLNRSDLSEDEASIDIHVSKPEMGSMEWYFGH